MDYVTRQFINLVKHFRKDLRKALSDLTNALHKQTEAIRKAYQVTDDKQGPSPEVAVLNNLPSSIEVHQNEHGTKAEKNYRLAMFGATTLTLGAIVVYAVLVFWQYEQMIQTNVATQLTFREIQKQTKLARQQLVGTLSAVVNIADPVSPVASGDGMNITFGFRNYGHIIANKFHFAVKIQILRMADQQFVGKQWLCSHEFSVITPTLEHTPTPGEHVFIQCFITGLTKEDAKAISELKRTIAIDGNYTYENGFGDPKEESICYRYVPNVQTSRGMEGGNTFETCDVFPKDRAILLNDIAAKQH
jgi:hypothetical protein